MLALALAVLLCPLALVSGQGKQQTQSPAQVLEDLLARYGDNSTITVPQLRSLLALLSQGQGEADSDNNNVAETPTSTPPKINSSKVRTKTCSPLWFGSIFSLVGVTAANSFPVSKVLKFTI